MTPPNLPAGATRSSGVGGQVAAAGAAVTGAGSALLATAATACCAGPVLAPIVVGVLGASGAAWAAGLKPYSAWMLAGSGVLLCFGFWSEYRKRAQCAPMRAGRANGMRGVVRVILWLSALLWAVAVAVNLLVRA